MYFLLDNDRLMVTHKHPDLFVLCDVAAIEQPDGSYDVWGFDNVRHLYKRTEAELAKLYLNLTGSQPTATGNKLRTLILEAAHRLPESDISPSEANHQAMYVEVRRGKADGEGPFVYVRGSNRPQRVAELPPGLTTVPATDEGAVLAAWVPPVAPKRPWGGLPQALREPAAPAPSASRPASQPKGGIRQTVWDRADAMWEAAGKPTDLKLVLALRKSIMSDLEANHGVKRTTSSNELGAWQKARIPG